VVRKIKETLAWTSNGGLSGLICSSFYRTVTSARRITSFHRRSFQLDACGRNSHYSLLSWLAVELYHRMSYQMMKLISMSWYLGDVTRFAHTLPWKLVTYGGVTTLPVKWLAAIRCRHCLRNKQTNKQTNRQTKIS